MRWTAQLRGQGGGRSAAEVRRTRARTVPEALITLDEAGKLFHLLCERRRDGRKAIANTGAHDVEPGVGVARALAQALHAWIAAGVAHPMQEHHRDVVAKIDSGIDSVG